MRSLQDELRKKIEDEMVERLYRWSMGEPSPPTRIIFNLTERCNLRCIFCTGILIQKGLFNKKLLRKENELTKDEWIRIAKEGTEFGIIEWEVCGGEPLLRADTFIGMLKVIKEINPDALVHLSTNGSLLTEKIAEKLVSLECDIVQLSIDGANAQTHDFLRGKKGSFKSVTNAGRLLSSAKKRLNKEKPAIQVYTVVNSKNYDELPELVSLTHSIGAGCFIANPMRVMEANIPFIKKANLELSEDQISHFPQLWKKVKEVAKEVGIKVHQTFYDWEVSKDKKHKKEGGDIKKYVNKFLNAFCLAPFCSLGVDALGNVGRCAAAYRHSSPVNLRGKSIREVWYGEFFEAARKLMLEGKPLGKECKTCGIINQRFIMRSRLAALIGEKKPKIRTHPWGHEIISE